MSRTGCFAPSYFPNPSTTADQVITSAVASNLQNQRPHQPLRRSPRLHRRPQLDEITPQEVEKPPVIPGGRRPGPVRSLIHISSPRGQKRRREDHSPRSTKRRRTLVTPRVPEERSRYSGDIDPIDYWRRSGYYWPQRDWSKTCTDFNPTVSYLLAWKKSTGSLPNKRSDSELAEQSSNTPSDQKSRKVKSAPYQDVRYETLIATKGSFMAKNLVGASDASKSTYRSLLDTCQSVPRDTIFCDDLFEETCEAIRNRNEARVVRDISLLIVPSAENLAIRGDKHLLCLIESVNEGWNNSIPLIGTRPQPDYAVGFRREAFIEEQLMKL